MTALIMERGLTPRGQRVRTGPQTAMCVRKARRKTRHRAPENWSGLDVLVTAAALSTAAPAVVSSTGSRQTGALNAASVAPPDVMAGSQLVGGNGGASATPSPPEGLTGAGGPHGDVAAAASYAAKTPVQLASAWKTVGAQAPSRRFWV